MHMTPLTRPPLLIPSSKGNLTQPSNSYSSSSPSIILLSLMASSAARQQPEQGLNCPRCDSPNTKFCYYNNYSLSQPRHFCKTCRRYWTKGGVLRNVPVGGGCRKNKKSKSSALSRVAFNPIESFAAAAAAAPAVMASSCSIGFNGNNHGSIASSIESLSSVNQELHWKLQQQRLAVYFGGEAAQNESCVSTSSPTTQQGPNISFVATDQAMPAWFPETTSNYFLVPNTTSTSPTATNDNMNINNFSSSSNNNNNNNNTNSGNWNGIPGWIDMPQFTTLLP